MIISPVDNACTNTYNVILYAFQRWKEGKKLNTSIICTFFFSYFLCVGLVWSCRSEMKKNCFRIGNFFWCIAYLRFVRHRTNVGYSVHCNAQAWMNEWMVIGSMLCFKNKNNCKNANETGLSVGFKNSHWQYIFRDCLK